MCRKDPNLIMYSAGAKYHHEALNGTGYPEGLTKKDIPLEGQIIRVADEFDAITSKRQYKSHVGVCDTLKILIDKTKPDKSIKAKRGKINKKAVKALIKVISDDTEYEIYNLDLYINYLKGQMKRLEQIGKYKDKMNTARNESDRAYYENAINFLFETGETLENYEQVLKEYEQAYAVRKDEMYNLTQEFKNIKRLRV